ncbi:MULTISPECIES: LysM domain-containing protein [unclassified Dehalobacter]|uniref:LysM peptidoglycan-binding domain-containing protein n=1 Tax=unclassified Dehalobacter TaxID=2635733 RepID=UPI000E6B6F54|nr:MULTISPECIES: LysM domain-containing protein [unclassified Dehalobacter]RJE48370.1 peptidoglycan-binding protein [Dehalobacter sp. MCB1]TCX50439.1 LysM domain-containing protein [Dehalobacter sp. 14DCB1]TCX52321.1 LysM domain-containing protein [Dehalobacter sp. 12DCB1]
MKKYTIKTGDTFFLLAGRNGCCWQDIGKANPGVDPCALVIGQVINIPDRQTSGYGASGSAGSTYSNDPGNYLTSGYAQKRYDDVILEVEGVKIRVARIGEPTVPHEVHFILPRTEIRKVECPGNGVIETSIMLSNINIVNSPRIEGEKSALGVIYPQVQSSEKTNSEESR